MAEVTGDLSLEVSPSASASGVMTLPSSASASVSVSPAANGLVGDFGTAAVTVAVSAIAEALAGPVFEVGVVITTRTTIHINVQAPITYPAQPVVPDPPVDEGGGVWSYPSPTYGGIIMRPLYGTVVDMNTPVIEDGKPT